MSFQTEKWSTEGDSGDLQGVGDSSPLPNRQNFFGDWSNPANSSISLSIFNGLSGWNPKNPTAYYVFLQNTIELRGHNTSKLTFLVVDIFTSLEWSKWQEETKDMKQKFRETSKKIGLLEIDIKTWHNHTKSNYAQKLIFV